MGDDTRRDADESNGFPTCPNCGQPVVNVTIVGPTEAVAGPCRCRVPPDLVVDPLLEETGDDVRDADATDDEGRGENSTDDFDHG